MDERACNSGLLAFIRALVKEANGLYLASLPKPCTLGVDTPVTLAETPSSQQEPAIAPLASQGAVPASKSRKRQGASAATKDIRFDLDQITAPTKAKKPAASRPAAAKSPRRKAPAAKPSKEPSI